MSEGALRSLITQALIDVQLCKRLLNGGRELVLDRFDLSDAERSALAAIKADSLQAFAAQIESWIHKDEERLPWPYLVGGTTSFRTRMGGEGPQT